MLRVHCGHLIDEKERAFSSALDALVGVRFTVSAGWGRMTGPACRRRPTARAPGTKAA
jgi:hypothetical protein